MDFSTFTKAVKVKEILLSSPCDVRQSCINFYGASFQVMIKMECIKCTKILLWGHADAVKWSSLTLEMKSIPRRQERCLGASSIHDF